MHKLDFLIKHFGFKKCVKARLEDCGEYYVFPTNAPIINEKFYGCTMHDNVIVLLASENEVKKNKKIVICCNLTFAKARAPYD